jgi:putative tryptophan/tyrosine transport system substrate-binding protein
VVVLKEIAPSVTRVAVLRDPSVISGNAQFAAIQSMASLFAVELLPVDVNDPHKIEHSITAFAREPNGGLIVTASIQATIHRDLIIALAARHRLPAVYPTPFYVAAGGLISYGSVFDEQYRRAADYVNRILKGAKPADLPVQAPIKYEMVLNLKTARALDLEIPDIVFARIDRSVE